MTDNITLPRATVVQALEALLEGLYTGKKERFEIALRTLSAALVQPEQQAEPVTREGFNEWWDGDYDDSENRFEKDSAAYWAWAGWQAAQRPWVGLTDEEILSTDPWEILRADPWMGTSDSNINPYQILLKVRTLEAKLKERNT